jgi:4-alpha-glucanotransferase
MRDCGVLSYRLLLFERGRGGHFLPPEGYPELAAAPFSTHDLATLKGFWLGHDLDWRRRLDLYPKPELALKEAQERRRDRRRLLEALTAAGMLGPGAVKRLLPRDDEPIFATELAEAVHGFLGRAKARLALLQIEDALCELEQPNLPGTVDQHPNWRRKLSLSLDQALREPLLHRLAAILDEERAEKRRATGS